MCFQVGDETKVVKSRDCHFVTVSTFENISRFDIMRDQFDCCCFVDHHLWNIDLERMMLKRSCNVGSVSISRNLDQFFDATINSFHNHIHCRSLNCLRASAFCRDDEEIVISHMDIEVGLSDVGQANVENIIEFTLFQVGKEDWLKSKDALLANLSKVVVIQCVSTTAWKMLLGCLY